MTIKYHGTPISPNAVLLSLRGRNFCVSFFRPDQIEAAHRIGQSVMIDNGAFSAWRERKRRGSAEGFGAAYWARYYEFCRQWCTCPTTWAVIPDVIDAGSQEQDALIREWPAELRGRAAPVWHMSEPLERLLRLTEEWPRVCVGSTDDYSRVLSPDWRERMDAAWDLLAQKHRATPWVHMLRGMQLVEHPWPFASVDSTDLGRNHNRLSAYGERRAWALKQKADRWDAANCPPTWPARGTIELFGDAA